MFKIGEYLLAAGAICAALFFGVNYMVSSLIERGRVIERAGTVQSRLEAEQLAHEHYIRTAQALEAERRINEALLLERGQERGRLRDERTGDGDGGAVVFDERWSRWLQHGAVRPSGN